MSPAPRKQVETQPGACQRRLDDGRTCGQEHPTVQAAKVERPEGAVWCCGRGECVAFLLWGDERWEGAARMAASLARCLAAGPVLTGPHIVVDTHDTTGSRGRDAVRKWVEEGRPEGKPVDLTPVDREALRRHPPQGSPP